MILYSPGVDAGNPKTRKYKLVVFEYKARE